MTSPPFLGDQKDKIPRLGLRSQMEAVKTRVEIFSIQIKLEPRRFQVRV